MNTSSVLKSTPEVLETESGILPKDRSELAAQLSKALANTYILYLKTQGVHWNVVGPLFYSIHKLTETQYQDMATAIDSIAERIRAIGFPAPSSLIQFEELASINEETGLLSAEKMIEQLVSDNEKCCQVLRKSVAEADSAGDVKTADLLTDRIGQHEENAWMLRALIS